MVEAIYSVMLTVGEREKQPRVSRERVGQKPLCFESQKTSAISDAMRS